MKRTDIHMRDPFVLLHEGTYYLYGSTDDNTWEGPGTGFDFYKSQDLENFEGPFPAFRPEEDFWGKENFWAPEVWPYKGKFYMLASFIAEGYHRGVQVLCADAPEGPFKPVKNGAVTPKDWECLDGTLYFDEESHPWMVFSHEWRQIGDGAFCCIQLSEDLKEAVTEPEVLFHASNAPWTISNHEFGQEGNVTDGPFLVKNSLGETVLMWSGFSKNGYTIGQAVSKNGRKGPWMHPAEPIYDKDGGHGMLFRKKDGSLWLAIHTPNETGKERPIFLEIEEKDGLFRQK